MTFNLLLAIVVLAFVAGFTIAASATNTIGNLKTNKKTNEKYIKRIIEDSTHRLMEDVSRYVDNSKSDMENIINSNKLPVYASIQKDDKTGH